MPPQPNEVSSRRALFWTVSAFFLALTINANGGRYTVGAMWFLSFSILSALIGTYFPNFLASVIPNSVTALQGVLVMGSTVFAALGLMPGESSFPLLTFLAYWGGCIAVAAIVWRLSSLPLLKRFLFPTLLLFQTLTWVGAVTSARQQENKDMYFHVRNDVQIFAEIAADELTHGKNPYSVHMPNVMGQDMPYYSEGTTTWTPGDGKVKEGTLTFGYPYLPLTALWSLPGHWLGDFRFMHVVALIGAAFFLAYARPSTTSQLAATFFLLFPSAVFVLIMSWIEPVVLFFLAASVFCYFRAPKWLFLALGCLIASKQYTAFLLPLVPLLVPERKKWLLLSLQAIGVAILLTVPMALWDWPGFYRSVLEIQFKQPFREDSLSYLVTILEAGGPRLSPSIGFAALLGGIGIGLWKAPRQPSLWCSAAAVAFMGFFALNKQAFANYYFWPFGLLVAAVAIALPPSEGPVSNQEPKPSAEGVTA